MCYFEQLEVTGNNPLSKYECTISETRWYREVVRPCAGGVFSLEGGIMEFKELEKGKISEVEGKILAKWKE